jgi:glutathione synthase/RimK-type ligase-like ATP-grasp enzyme
VILLCGNATELAPIATALRARRATYIVVDEDSTATEVDLGPGVWDGVIRTSGTTLELGAISAMYLRPRAPRPSAAWARLMAWADEAPVDIVNPPSAGESNGSKPLQAGLIARHGFRTPETLVTTDVTALAGFRRRHGPLIYKSISAWRSHVAMLDDSGVTAPANLRWCPTMFQEYIPGTEYRATVVGDRVFAARIESTAIDYRHAQRSGEEVRIDAAQLPVEIESRVLALCRSLRLRLAGADLRQTPGGDWVCFEVNPSPDFRFYEAATGQQITGAIADLLAAAELAHDRHVGVA